MPPTRHNKFYFSDGNVVFQVEDTLFRIHRSFLIQDENAFSSMFSFPSGQGDKAEGSIDEKPILLPEVKAAEFSMLLVYLYTAHIHGIPIAFSALFNWLTVFRMAERFSMATVESKIRVGVERAYGLVPSSQADVTIPICCQPGLIPFVDALAICMMFPQGFQVKHRRDLFTYIVKRADPLTPAEGHKLGVHLSVCIAGAREALRKSSEVDYSDWQEWFELAIKGFPRTKS